ncbi:tRNA (adenosine(37)-N6)-threonylcarbamoyltransferase complex dimerization subunit type 1 TsaB [Breznakiellaceae bacterium SP9]
MNILAIDTSCNTFSAALEANEQFWYIEAQAGQRHSELIIDLSDCLCSYAGIKAAALDAVACMKGPGSFTGLRIGFSCAKGIALAQGCRFIPISTLDCMADSFSFWPGIVVPLIFAKKERFYTALFQGGKQVSPPADANIAAIIRALKQTDTGKGILLTGHDAQTALPLLKEADPQCLWFASGEQKKGFASELLKLAKRFSIINGEKEIQNEAIFSCPQYLRESDAEIVFNATVG